MQGNAFINGCLVCGKTYEQVIDKTAADFLRQAAQPYETNRERLLKRRAFIDGLQCGVFTFDTRGVNDGQVYDIMCRNVLHENYGTFLPLFQDGSLNSKLQNKIKCYVPCKRYFIIIHMKCKSKYKTQTSNYRQAQIQQLYRDANKQF